MRLMLNNKPLFQIGPLDQGWWPDGLLTPPSDEAMKYDLEVLKKLGFNMLRKHIKVEPARLLLPLRQARPARLAGHAERRHAEPQAVHPRRTRRRTRRSPTTEKKQFRAELKAMIDHLRFFPCIVVWVPFNEGWGQHDTNDILKWVKEYDPTRLVNGPSGWTDRGFGDMKDMHSYPGPGMFPVMPDRVSVLGEFGGLGLPLKGHLWKDTDNWGYRTFKTTEELRDELPPADAAAAPAHRQGARGRGLHADDRRRGRGERPDDLRPRGASSSTSTETAKWHKALFGPPPEYRDARADVREGRRRSGGTRPTKPADGWEKPDFDDAQVEGGRRRVRHEGDAGRGRPHRVEDARHLAAPRRSS